MKYEIRDNAYKLMGWTEAGNDKDRVYDNGGTLRGWFDKTDGKTYDSGNRLIGYGNLLITLL